MDYKDMKPIGLVRLMLTDGVITVEQAAKYFPEFKESEGERIRKALLNEFIFLQSKGYKFAGLEGEKIIAWLERQGEQKAAWSEEDENLFRCAIDAVKQESKVRTDGCLDEEVGEMVTNWLKFLKERVGHFDDGYKVGFSAAKYHQWRPSDEQIEALEYFVRSVGESGYASPYSNNTKLLYSLLFDLKKLREE